MPSVRPPSPHRPAPSPRVALLALLALFATGCVKITDFKPVGNDTSLEASWTIDGAYPTSERCQELGANQVRVVFLDGLRPVPVGALIHQCASCSASASPSCYANRACTMDGQVECLDTSPNRVILAGTWTVRVEALNGATVIGTGPEQTIDATEMGHVTVDPVDFLSARISATYTLDGATPTFDTCDAAGIDAVELYFETASGTVAGGGSEPCTVGEVGNRVAGNADYAVRLRALAADGSVVGETAPESFSPMPGDHLTLAGGAAIELSSL